MAAAWTAHKDKIKSKYITETKKPTFRELAREFGGNKDTIRRWAVEENWDCQRERHEAEIETEVLQNDRQIKTNRAKKIAEATDLLLDGIIAGIGAGRLVTPTAAKNYSEAIKNIKDIHMIRSEEDIEEQKARIAKLQREAEKDDKSSSVTVIIEGDRSYGE